MSLIDTGDGWGTNELGYVPRLQKNRQRYVKTPGSYIPSKKSRSKLIKRPTPEMEMVDGEYVLFRPSETQAAKKAARVAQAEADKLAKEEARAAAKLEADRKAAEVLVNFLDVEYTRNYNRKVASVAEPIFDDCEAGQVKLADIMARMAQAYGVTAEQIAGKGRSKFLVVPRHGYFYWARRLTSHSYPVIAKACGGRDHTTALHGVKAYAKRHGLPGVSK